MIVAGERTPDQDQVLIRGLARALEWMAAIREGTPISQISREAKVSEDYI